MRTAAPQNFGRNPDDVRISIADPLERSWYDGEIHSIRCQVICRRSCCNSPPSTLRSRRPSHSESCLRGGNDGKAARLRNQSFPQGRAGFAPDGTISGENRRPLNRRRGSISEPAVPTTPERRETDPVRRQPRAGQRRNATLTPAGDTA